MIRLANPTHLAIFFVLSLLGFLSGTGCVPVEPEQRSVNSIKIREAAEPSSINPFYIRDELGFYLCSQIWQPLLAVDFKTEELVGVLAESTPKINSTEKWQMEIHYQLRREAKFSNGETVGLNDVIFSIKANLSPLINPYYSTYYDFIDSLSIDCQDSSCFTIYSRDSYYLSEFSSGDYFILPESYFDGKKILRNYSFEQLKGFSKETAPDDLLELAEAIEQIDFQDSIKPIGSAPYLIEEWLAGEKLSLSKQENWWGDQFKNENIYFVANAKQLDFYFVEDATTALNALKNEKFDLMRSIPPKQYRELEKNERFLDSYRLEKTGRFAYQYLGYNLNNSLLSDLNFRKAIAFSVPRKDIIEQLYYGLAETCNSLGASERNKEAPYLNYSEDSASFYLNSFISDHPDTELSLRYTYNAGNDKRKAIGLILKEKLKHIGVEVEIEAYEWSVYLKKLKSGDVDLFLNGTVSSVMTPDLSNSFHSSAIQSGRNYFNFADPKTDQLLDSINACLDPEKREVLFNKLENRLLPQLPIYLLMRPYETLAFSKQLESANAYRLRPNYWVPEITKN